MNEDLSNNFDYQIIRESEKLLLRIFHSFI